MADLKNLLPSDEELVRRESCWLDLFNKWSVGAPIEAVDWDKHFDNEPEADCSNDNDSETDFVDNDPVEDSSVLELAERAKALAIDRAAAWKSKGVVITMQSRPFSENMESWLLKNSFCKEKSRTKVEENEEYSIVKKTISTVNKDNNSTTNTEITTRTFSRHRILSSKSQKTSGSSIIEGYASLPMSELNIKPRSRARHREERRLRRQKNDSSTESHCRNTFSPSKSAGSKRKHASKKLVPSQRTTTAGHKEHNQQPLNIESSSDSDVFLETLQNSKLHFETNAKLNRVHAKEPRRINKYKKKAVESVHSGYTFNQPQLEDYTNKKAFNNHSTQSKNNNLATEMIPKGSDEPIKAFVEDSLSKTMTSKNGKKKDKSLSTTSSSSILRNSKTLQNAISENDKHKEIWQDPSPVHSRSTSASSFKSKSAKSLQSSGILPDTTEITKSKKPAQSTAVPSDRLSEQISKSVAMSKKSKTSSKNGKTKDKSLSTASSSSSLQNSKGLQNAISENDHHKENLPDISDVQPQSTSESSVKPASKSDKSRKISARSKKSDVEHEFKKPMGPVKGQLLKKSKPILSANGANVTSSVTHDLQSQGEKKSAEILGPIKINLSRGSANPNNWSILSNTSKITTNTSSSKTDNTSLNCTRKSVVLFSPKSQNTSSKTKILLSAREIAKIANLDHFRCLKFLGKNMKLDDTIELDPNFRYTFEFPEHCGDSDDSDGDELDFAFNNRGCIIKGLK